MKSGLLTWQFWALLSAGFAALTAIFAKIGVGNVNSDFATLLRTVVILCALALILASTGQCQRLGSISGRSYAFLLLSGLATGASWICYFRALKIGDAARVAPVDKLSVVLVAVFGVIFRVSACRRPIGRAWSSSRQAQFWWPGDKAMTPHWWHWSGRTPRA
ncbi:transporter family protein [Rhodoligotrophos appendicifer]